MVYHYKLWESLLKAHNHCFSHARHHSYSPTNHNLHGDTPWPRGKEREEKMEQLRDMDSALSEPPVPRSMRTVVR